MSTGAKYRNWSEWILARSAEVFLLLLVLGTSVWLFGLYYYDNPQKVSDAAAALAIIVGGGWTLYQFVLRRAFETSLAIEVTVRTSAFDETSFVTFLQVTFQNMGARRITVPPVLTREQIMGYEESVLYPADLQIKKINATAKAPSFLGWWGSKQKEGKLSIIEGMPAHISMLYEYSFSDGTIDFFMEGGEKYDIGSTFLLPRGHYLAKVVFIGERARAAEFWSRIVYFSVP